MKKVLTIAGSDCSGGAGIQADIKTITMHNMYAMSVITAQTAQNTMGVFEVVKSDADFISKQLDCIFDDITPDAIKIGMVCSKEIIETITAKLKKYGAKNIVLDPILLSTSNAPLLEQDAREVLINELMPISTLITPNIPEAEVIADMKIENDEDVVLALKKISEMIKTSVLIKGGHKNNNADDLLYHEGSIVTIGGERIQSNNTHGTGCTLSSAIACNLASGASMTSSVVLAKRYITKAIESGLDIGKGNGPINHMHCMS